MRILLDTCDFLWFISGDRSLPPSTQQAIQDPNNEIFLSVVSLWEITIKHALGRLPLPQTPDAYIPAQRERHGIQSLSLQEAVVKRLVKLPAIHRDPFDRILVCQAQEHDLHLASSDSLVAQYPVTLLP
ncbi:MAG: type II toxin-antitoxin system VapC family toxin [Verrucomicrobia bacterium]|nr:type II toxin-antitoxin system VapC family toxin [Verrucomicrobiota bacterium]